MLVLSIKNFSLYQHYKDRRPPWVKLHASVLDDYAFECLQDASKAHLMLLWVLASQCDNKIPYDLGWIARRIGAKTSVDIEELISQGFIEVFEDASKPLAARKQTAMLETEVETEVETEKKRTSPRKKPRGGSSAFLLAPYLDAHRAAFSDSDPPAGRYGKVFKRLEQKHGAVETLRRWQNCLAKKALFATPEELGTHWSEYAEGGAADHLESRAAALLLADAAAEADTEAWLAAKVAS